MKRIIISLTLIVVSLVSQAQTDTTKQKLYTLRGDLQSYQAVLAVVDKSTASHLEVEAVKAWIVNQVNAQLQAEAAAVEKPKPPVVTKPKTKN